MFKLNYTVFEILCKHKIERCKKHGRPSFFGSPVFFLFYGYAFCQIARLVNIQPADGGNVIGKQLEG